MQFAAEQRIARDANATAVEAELQPEAVLRTPKELISIVSLFASSDGWMDRVRLRVEHRWYERVYQDQEHDIWVISWLPGQSTGFHDHGKSSGAFVVATGVLEEHRPGEEAVVVQPGKPRAFGPDYTHDVRNVSLAPAVSIHAYSPPLSDMNKYELDGHRLVPRERALEPTETNSRERSTIEQMLEAARARLTRLSPYEAYTAVAETEAILVDIRPERQRAIEGSIPDALIVERNVIEWRFDPASGSRLPIARDHNVPVIVFCSEGYTSSLAAAALQDLGLWRATDMVGGFQAWHATGLPTGLPTIAS
jgi:rhodanese-related sulfurtransferase/mannose-6-phosphate isomerase-like protein (cupin superfamily)